MTGSTVVVTGRWGFSEDTETAGTLAAAVSDTTGTSVDVSDSSAIGIGDLVLVDSEQLLVTSKSQLDSGENLGGNLTADKADVTVDLTDGSQFTVGEIILIDSERMLLVDISGNNGTVRRAYDGTVLAAHTSGADIYAPRTLTVERGAVGTTAATHSNGAALVRNVPPALITDLTIAEAVYTYEQEAAGYGRTIGDGEAARESRGTALMDLRSQAKTYSRLRAAAV